MPLTQVPVYDPRVTPSRRVVVPSPGPTFTLELAESKTLKKIGELTQARGRTLTDTFNKAGALQMTLPLMDPLARLVEEIATCVVVKRLGKWIWSGPVWTVQETTPDSVAVGCVGWLQTLENRLLYPVGAIGHAAWQRLQYTDVDAGEIVLDLLAQSNADNVFGDTNYVIPGSFESTQGRTRTFQPWSQVLTEINNLSEIESGYDMRVDPRTRELDIYQRIGVLKANVYFEYGANLSSVSRTCDASRVCNRMIAYSSIGWAQADDLVSQAAYGVIEEAVSLSDVRDIGILQAYANAELAIRSVPLRFHSFEPRPFSNSSPNDPRIYEDFVVGDNVYLKARRGRLQVPRQAVRIFSATITLDDVSGQEQLTSLQTTMTGVA